jgi:Mat/Ecp fimbriae major subunit
MQWGILSLLFVTKDQFMLNKSKIALAGAIAAAALVSTGAQAATEIADARVEIIAPVTLLQTAQLDFGIVAPGAGAGTVTMGTGSGTPTCSAGLTCVGGGSRGTFDLTAAAGYSVDITVDTSTSLSNGAQSMTLTLAPGAATIIANGGTQTFYVGGSLAVGANQAAGTYVGTYDVSAEYQ